ncbi:MAG: acyltransferase family protein [Burkholderiales bacterium]
MTPTESLALQRPRAAAKPGRAPLIDAVKVLATQLIVWHHLALYGPMSDVVYPYASGLIDWLYNEARLVVQVFLVIGGYLAAQSLWPRLAADRAVGSQASTLGLIWRRYLRLVKPYAAALLLAMASAALARALMDHDATPSAPTSGQVAAHLLLAHDILGFEGLSAGVWYVAIDFQLFALLALLTAATQAIARRTGVGVEHALLWACSALVVASLCWFNREAGLDVWAPYFFGAYGLGVLAQAVAQRQRRSAGTLALAALLGLALAVDWRSRVLVAGITALVLASGAARATRWPAWMSGPVIGGLARISYAQFLVHYPVCLAVNALVAWAWPAQAGFNMLGLVMAWGFSLAAAALFYRWVEAPRPLRPRPAPSPSRPGQPVVS